MRYPSYDSVTSVTNGTNVTLVFILFLLLLTGCDNASSVATKEGGTPGGSLVNDNNSVDFADGDQQPDKPVATPEAYSKLALADVAGTTEKISIASDGTAADGNSISAAISSDGRYVVFESFASTLIPNDNNNTWDIFLRDRERATTQRISNSMDGGDPNDTSLEPEISNDGSVVAFTSSANNLVADDLNASSDIFVYDSSENSIQRISIDSMGVESDGDSRLADLSGDGRYVVFESTAESLVTGDNNQVVDVFLHDRVNQSTQRVSVGNLGEEANAGSFEPAVSDDGRFVVFSSDADNLVVGDDNGVRDIFVRDLLENTTRRVSVSSDGLQADAISDSPEISGNGTVTVFRSAATNLVTGDTNSARDIFSHDLLSGHTARITVNNVAEEANGTAFTMPTINVDGRYIAYYSAATNMVANDINSAWDVFVHDRSEQFTQIVSVSSEGVIGDASSFEPGISANGRYVVFGSAAGNLVAEELNSAWDIFLHVLVTANLAPVADAGVDQSVFLGETVQLDGSNSFDPDANAGSPGAVKVYHWQFENMPVGSNVMLEGDDSATPQFVPDVPGMYLLSLVVSDGELNSVVDEVLVNVVENLDPVAAIDVQVVSGNVPLIVQVDASKSLDPEGGELTIHWDFGDPGSEQNTSSEFTPQHTYTKAGNYTIVLTVTDPLGNTDKASVSISVLAANNPPSVNPTATPVSGSAPLTVNFKANATDPENDTLAVSWVFGDGVNSDLPDPIHVYAEPGVYEVSVTVTDGEFRSTASVTIVVNPQLDFTTQHAVVVLNNHHDDNDKLFIKATYDASGVPDQGDIIRFVMDGIILLEVPFSEFVNLGDDSQKFWFTRKHEMAMLNLDKGVFKLYKHKAMLGGIDYSNGTNVIFSMGDNVATQAINLRQVRWRSRDDDDNHDDYDEETHRIALPKTWENQQPGNKTVLVYKVHNVNYPDARKKKHHSDSDHDEREEHLSEWEDDEEEQDSDED